MDMLHGPCGKTQRLVYEATDNSPGKYTHHEYNNHDYGFANSCAASRVEPGTGSVVCCHVIHCLILLNWHDYLTTGGVANV
ncbi:MAG: hypothetical protein DHS20C01_28610 [marine bacterium B5-7]|nr:MAG: hypothetical protein DHS20C01_28610 [marine bacterium B5-7]